MKKQPRKLVLHREQVRMLTAADARHIVGGLKNTDASNATKCLPETPPGSCQDNTAHFCGQL